MDKSWILKDRDSLDYEIGVENFLIFAKENAVDCKNIPCPCGRCGNFKKFSVKIIRGHLYENGFSLGYTEWIWHGEKCVETRSSAGSSYPPDLKWSSNMSRKMSIEHMNSDDTRVRRLVIWRLQS